MDTYFPAGLPDYAGRRVVITGAAVGFGRLLALSLCAAGARVFAVDKHADALATLAEKAGPALVPVVVDLRDPDATASIAAAVAEGPLHGLVLSAAHRVLAPHSATRSADMHDCMRVNALSPLELTAQLFPQLHAGRARIICVGSRFALPSLVSVAASKAALAGMCRALHAEWGPQGIHVVTLDPGLLDSPGTREVVDAWQNQSDTAPPQAALSAYEDLKPIAEPVAAVLHLLGHIEPAWRGEMVTTDDVLSPSRDVDLTPAADASRDELLALCTQVAADISAQDVGFGTLPVFVRPVARNTFRALTGMDAEGWTHALGILRRQLAALESPDAGSVAAFAARSTLVEAHLRRLMRYYDTMPDLVPGHESGVTAVALARMARSARVLCDALGQLRSTLIAPR